MFTLGTIALSAPVIAAPMAGISSFPLRLLNREFGCELAFTEMIDVRSLCSHSKKTEKMLYATAIDRPLGVQIVGSDEYYLLKAVEILLKRKFDLLDFNAACPERKVTSKGKGAALLKEPRRLQHLLKQIVNLSSIPVMAKIRLGWDNPAVAADIAASVEDSGVQAICVHGRTRAQGYSGGVNYDGIRLVKKAVRIPVIGSGDVFSPQLAKKMLDETGCDAVAVARGALGHPWLFQQIKEFLRNNTLLPQPPLNEINRVMKKHLGLFTDFYGEKTAVVKFRKFFIWYTHGYSNIKPLRARSARIKTRLEMNDLIDEFCGAGGRG